MKKIIFATILIVITNASVSMAGQFKSRWGVVMSVTPVSITTNYSKPYTRLICNKSNLIQSSNFAEIAVGGLIGSVIGNKLSDTHGAGSLGALFGSMIAYDKPKRHQTENCFEKTYYSNQNITKFSHYNIKVRTKRRILNIQSRTSYNIHDVIFLN